MSKLKYKVGDRVKMRSLQWCKENIFNNEDKYPPELFSGIEKFCGKILTISDAVDKSKYVDEGYYNMDEDTEWDYYWTDEMIECKVEEETLIERVDDNGFPFNEWLSHKGAFHVPDGYELKDENGNEIHTTKIVLEKKKKEYPKTYEECLKVLGFNVTRKVKETPVFDYDEDIIALQKLKRCRDAYWKIAGDEMGLGKPWKPDWTNQELPKYCIAGVEGQTKTAERYIVNTILAFPTAEMRNAFYENFNELIEECKDFL